LLKYNTRYIIKRESEATMAGRKRHLQFDYRVLDEFRRWQTTNDSPPTIYDLADVLAARYPGEQTPNAYRCWQIIVRLATQGYIVRGPARKARTMRLTARGWAATPSDFPQEAAGVARVSEPNPE